MRTPKQNYPMRALVKQIVARMTVFQEGANRCLERLNDAKMWQRLHPKDNAIGNLVLHATGSLRRWIISGVGGDSDGSERQSEFDVRGGLTRVELAILLRQTVEASCNVIDSLPAEKVLERGFVQNTDNIIAYAMVGAVAHLGIHAGVGDGSIGFRLHCFDVGESAAQTELDFRWWYCRCILWSSAVASG